ncbi:MAG: hypothetical protein BroJett025_10250 [Patescibacteria group bacterium]|nr:MAG: hypothetical protein BroJett025_10250 [Patescibacteria group bacterium]
MHKSFCIDLASKKVEISANTDNVFEHLMQSYSNFIVRDSRKTNINLQIKGIKTRKNYKPISDISSRSGKIIIPNNANLSFSEIHFNIKIVLTQLLIQDDFMLLHASAFIKNNNMYIMSAPSGTGKSTTCRFAKEKGLNVVCDDSVLLRVENRKLIGYTTPYIETHKKVSSPQSYQVAGIYFLHQSKTDKLQKQNTVESVRSILFNSYIFQNDYKEKYISKYFSLAHVIASRTKTYDLFFTKSSKFLGII